MNCNQTFDILTRGPFPSGNDRDDFAVEDHLAACHECRQLAEALRPAVGLFHEALTGSEWLSLPGYRGELSPAADTPLQTMVAIGTASPARAAHPFGRSSRLSPLLFGTFVATCLLGFLLGIFGNQLITRPSPTADGTISQRTRSNHKPDREGLELLAALGLPSTCLDTTANHADTIYRCCTHCHAAAQLPPAPAVSLVSLTTSCTACHSQADRAELSWLHKQAWYGRFAT